MFLQEQWQDFKVEPNIEVVRDILIKNFDANNNDHQDLIQIKEEALERYPDQPTYRDIKRSNL